MKRSSFLPAILGTSLALGMTISAHAATSIQVTPLVGTERLWFAFVAYSARQRLSGTVPGALEFWDPRHAKLLPSSNHAADQ